MSYTIHKSDGTAIIIADNALDVAYYAGAVPPGIGIGQILIGRNTIDYGSSIAQNFLQLTENFSSPTGSFPSDATALQGQLWFNKLSGTSGNLYVRTSGATSGGMANWAQLLTTASGVGTVSSITAGTGLSGGTITTSGTISLANISGVAGSYIAADITIDAQGRIIAAANGSGVSVSAGLLTGTTLASNVVTSSLTSVGTLGSLSVTGTTTSGTFSGAGTSLTGTAAGLTAGVATTVATNVTSDAASYYPLIIETSGGNQPAQYATGLSFIPSTSTLSATTFAGAFSGAASANVLKAGDTMTGLLILSADPSNLLGAATKQYVDAISSGINAHGACETSTTVASNLSANTYTNGTQGWLLPAPADTGLGVNATITANANVVLGTVGGYARLGLNSRLLVKDQSDTTQNGVYVVTSLGSTSGPTTPWILTRAPDYNNSIYGEVRAGDTVYIQEGSNAGTQWVQTSVGTQLPDDITKIGLTFDPIVFSQFASPGIYTAGTGISLPINAITNTGVLSVTTNTGLSSNVSAAGNVTITNTGVLSNTAGTNITVSSSTGAVTIGTSTTPTFSTVTSTVSTGTAPFIVTSTTPVANLSIGGSAPAGSLSGTTLAPGVTTSSLTSVGTITSGAWNGTAIANAHLANAAVANLSGTNTGDNAINTNYASDYRAANFVAGVDYLTPAGTAAIATRVTTNVTADNATYYPVIVEASSAPGNEAAQYATSFNYNPYTGVLTAPTFSGIYSSGQLWNDMTNVGGRTLGFLSANPGTITNTTGAPITVMVQCHPISYGGFGYFYVWLQGTIRLTGTIASISGSFTGDLMLNFVVPAGQSYYVTTQLSSGQASIINWQELR